MTSPAPVAPTVTIDYNAALDDLADQLAAASRRCAHLAGALAAERNRANHLAEQLSQAARDLDALIAAHQDGQQAPDVAPDSNEKAT